MVSKSSDKDDSKEVNSDVQSYLITKYRDALKRGDKSAAKSCLLAARYFSVNDPNVTNEIYLMAKSDGDVTEASKCFANIYNDLFITNRRSPSSPGENHDSSSETSIVMSQIKEEMRLLLNELKSHFLKLKSTPNSPSRTIAMRQAHSVSQSPLLSPRLRMSSEDRAASRDSLAKLDSHLHSKTQSLFYQQLFENLPKDVRMSLIDRSIETCDNSLEKCRLMILSISIFGENVVKYGNQLINTLIALSQPEVAVKMKLLTSCPPMIVQYAKSLLVLDAIPLILSTPESDGQDFELEELLYRTLAYYSEFYLNNIAVEYDFDELHEGLKKTIAARILGKDNSPTQDDGIEDNLIAIIDLLFEKYIHVFDSEPEIQKQLRELRSFVTAKSNHSATSDMLIEASKKLDLRGTPLNFIEHPTKERLANTDGNTPPPKSRGRPKRSQQPVPENEIRSHYIKACQANFVFYSIMQHLFINSAKYLRQTRSRVMLKFSNPLASLIESELSKATSQRSSRSKHLTSEPGSSPSKKIKLEVAPTSTSTTYGYKDSPLNSVYSKLMDQAILKTLSEAYKCIDFITNDSWCHSTIEPLWNLFIENNTDTEKKDLLWYDRVTVDSSIMAGNYDDAVTILNRIVNEKRDENNGSFTMKERVDAETSTLTIIPGSSPSGVLYLRALTQLISCHVQLVNRYDAYSCIDDLLTKIRQAGLISNDESYSTGNIIEEYMSLVEDQGENQLNGFLFFDGLSMIRYCVDILMCILKRYIISLNALSDSVIGHIITISQFDWPKESPLYEQCVTWLRTNKPKSTTPQCLSSSTKFTYDDFFNYIFNPNIIEDFMAMLNQGYTLDIKNPNISGSQQSRTGGNQKGPSGGTSTRSGKAITTRGVNKTFKEDLKVALIAQMKQSTSLMPLDLVTDFIHSSLLPFLGLTK